MYFSSPNSGGIRKSDGMGMRISSSLFHLKDMREAPGHPHEDCSKVWPVLRRRRQIPEQTFGFLCRRHGSYTMPKMILHPQWLAMLWFVAPKADRFPIPVNVIPLSTLLFDQVRCRVPRRWVLRVL
jgi:hypothetical protein